MTLIASLALLLFNAAFTDAAGSIYGDKWTYRVNGVLGPDRWASNITTCGGQRQSPINILTKHVKINKDLKLKLNNYDQIGKNITFAMENRNTDVAFKGKPKSGNMSQTVTFQGTTYRFWQFHFHWGKENFKGSEHLVDWQRYAAELHMIHFNTKYTGIGPAHTQDDGLLVWGHFLKVNSKDAVDNEQFQKLLDQFSKVEKCCNKTDVDVNLMKLLPKSHDKFYTYSGGLTTPPCHQSVRWVVNKEPLLVSEKQMETFRTLKDSKMGGYLGDNFRPPQNLFTRVVESNFDPAAPPPAAGAGSVVAPCFLTLFSIAAALMFSF